MDQQKKNSIKRNGSKKFSREIYMVNYFIAFVLIVAMNLSFDNTSLAQNDSTITADTILVNEYHNKAKDFYSNINYDSSIFYFKKILSLYDKIGYYSSDYFKCCNDIGKLYTEQGFYDKALGYFTNILENSPQKIGANSLVISDTYINLGTLYSLQSNITKSNDYLDQASSIVINYYGNEHKYLSYIYNMIAINFAHENKFNNSLEYFEKALPIYIKNFGENHHYVGNCYNNLGLIYYYMGDIEKAVTFYRKSIDMLISQFGESHADLSKSYNNLGLVYANKGDYDKALFYYFKAVNIIIKVHGDNHPDLAIRYENIGNIYRKINEFDKALDYINKALSIRFKRLEKNHRLIASNYISIGDVYYDINENNKATEFYDKALAILLHKADEIPEFVASIYESLGNIYKEKELYETAIKYFEKTLIIYKKIYGESHHNIARSYYYLGSIYQKKNETDKAIQFYNKAQFILDTQFSGLHNVLADIYTRKGEIALNGKDFIESISYCQKAIISIDTVFNDTNIYKNPDLNTTISETDLLPVLRLKAHAFYQLYLNQTNNISNLNMSLSTYKIALKLVDKLKNSIKSDASKLFMESLVYDIYNQAINVALEIFKINNDEKYKELAFQFAEKNKSGVLFSALLESEAQRFSGIADTLILKEKQLKIDLAFYEKSILDENEKRDEADSSKISLWQGKVFDFNREYENLIASLEKEYPEYYNMKYNTKVVGLYSLQNRLSHNEVLIEYALADTALHSFVVSQHQFEVFTQAIDSSFFSDIDRFRTAITDKTSGNLSFADSENLLLTGNKLYQYLIKPIESLIKGKKLIIIPDRELSYIPFEVLLTRKPDPDASDFKNLPYLIKDYAVSYANSATILMNSLEKVDRYAGEDLLAFAPSFGEEYEMDDKLLAFLKERGSELGQLTGTKEEVKAIQKIVGGNVYLDSTATESVFKSLAPEYKIIHIATHGIIDDENPMYSKLLFYQDKDSVEDGYLNTIELFNMKLNAQLAVLSACNTGYGNLQNGEGVMSLARGFLYAGVPSITISLWDVNDEITVQLMESFYKYLHNGLHKDEALRKAKLDYLQNADDLAASPYYWAGFVNIGDSSPVQFSSNRNYWWILVLTVLILIGGYYVKKYKTNKMK